MRVYMRKSQGQYRQGLILARSGSPSFVAVVKSADEGWRYDGSHLGRVNRPWLR